MCTAISSSVYTSVSIKLFHSHLYVPSQSPLKTYSHQNLRLILLHVLRTQQSGCYTNSWNAKTTNSSSSCLPLCALIKFSLFPLSRPSSSHQCPLGPPLLPREITAIRNLLDSGKLAPRTDWLERSVTTTNTKTSPPRACESNLATWRSPSSCPEQN